jgi:hypothetical protein
MLGSLGAHLVSRLDSIRAEGLWKEERLLASAQGPRIAVQRLFCKRDPKARALDCLRTTQGNRPFLLRLLPPRLTYFAAVSLIAAKIT